MTTPAKTLTWQVLWRLIRYQPGLFGVDTLLWVLYMGLQPLSGLIMRGFFDTLTNASPLGWSPWTFLALMGGLVLGELAALFAAQFTKSQLRFRTSALLQRNLLAHLLAQPGAGTPGKTISTGEAISYFRDDVRQIEDSISRISVVLGISLTTIGSVALMLSISVSMTLLVLLPLIGIILVVQHMTNRIKRYRRASRQATERVTGVMGEIFNSVQAIKVAGAQTHVLKHLRQVNDQRRRMMLQDQLFTAILNSVFQNIITFGTGLILLVAALSAQSGTRALTIGEFAMFAYYLTYVTSTMSFLGQVFAMYKQTGVALERLETFLQPEPLEGLVASQPLYLKGLLGHLPELPPLDQPQPGQASDLHQLTVINLSYHYPDTGRGVTGLNLRLERGSFTVVTGRIGSGKTTLLRALLGLLPTVTGEIRWNGELVTDPASFFVPPRSAYTPQVPRLFSYTLRENLLLGLPADQANLVAAIRSAVMEQDVLALENGLDTLVGPKGVKLSGGQVQRAAAARMFVRAPELLVFDDLSSALDVETERTLWERLAEHRNLTCLVVSHRRAVLQRADHIIVLKEGRVEAEGRLEELLEHCEEMQRLWQGDLERG